MKSDRWRRRGEKDNNEGEQERMGRGEDGETEGNTDVKMTNVDEN